MSQFVVAASIPVVMWFKQDPCRDDPARLPRRRPDAPFHARTVTLIGSMHRDGNIMLEQSLKQLLGQYRPESLLVAGETARHIGDVWAEYAGIELTDVSEAPLAVVEHQEAVADLALVTELMGRLSHEEARQFLGWLRNAGARRVAVSLTPDDGWTFSDMVALAFHRHDRFDDGTELFTYDIETYNRPREWNNPRYWANPENWGKYRW